MFTLRNGSTTEDSRLTRIEEFDIRSRKYGVRSIIGTDIPITKNYFCDRHLNQGQEGACVGAGITHELISEPVPVRGLDMRYARENIYWQAQKEDDWEGGSYPDADPFYEGTSVLAGVKVAHKLGWFDNYYWCFGLEDLILGVGCRGPAVLGLAWYRGMHNIDENGYIYPSGQLSGGHCILCKGVNITHERFILHNSWGKHWGLGGDCYVSFDDMDFLLHQKGEAVIFIDRKLARI